MSIFLFVSSVQAAGTYKKLELKEVVVAQWGHTYYLIYLPFYVALDKNFFITQGLDVKIKFSGNDDQVFATVISGKATFGIGDPVFTAIAREKRGIKGKVVSLIVNKVSLWGVTNKNIPYISTYKDLNHLTIGTFPAPSTTYTIIKDIITQYHLDAKIQEAPIGSQLALLEKGLADVVMLLEPAASIAEIEKGYRVVMSLPQLWGEFAFTGVTTTEDWIKKDPQTIQAFVNAIEMALNYIYTHPEGAKEVARKFLKDIKNQDVIDKAVNRLIQDRVFPEHAAVSLQSWQKALQVRVETGDLASLKHMKDSIDNSFALKVQQNLP